MTTELDLRTTIDAEIIDLPDTGYVGRELTQVEADTISYHLSNARSENTRIAYESQWKGFLGWCQSNRHLAYPVTVETICLYLAYLADNNYKISKIEQGLSAIRAVHNDTDVMTLGVFSHPHIKATLTSIKRTMAHDGRSFVAKPRHFSQAEITAMVGTCSSGTPASIQEKAIILLGVNSGLRASEFSALNITDLVFESTGVDVRIASSKTDKFGKGVTLFIGRLAPHQLNLDAVQALQDWLEIRSQYPMGEGNLFLTFRKGGKSPHLNTNGEIHRVSTDGITSILNRRADLAGVDAGTQSISSHGLRHSFITQAFSRGMDSAKISKSSRHKSLSSLLEYDQTSRRDSTVSTGLWA